MMAASSPLAVGRPGDDAGDSSGPTGVAAAAMVGGRLAWALWVVTLLW
jgi:hypothetical protein